MLSRREQEIKLLLIVPVASVMYQCQHAKVARKLAQRLRSFQRYRCISRNMDMRFPDAGPRCVDFVELKATDAEIEENEHCVICASTSIARLSSRDPTLCSPCPADLGAKGAELCFLSTDLATRSGLLVRRLQTQEVALWAYLPHSGAAQNSSDFKEI